MEGATDGLSSSIPNFSLEQGIECDTYSLLGNQACSIIYSRTMDYTSELEFAVMQVATAIGNNAFMLTYMGTVNDFDQNLPVVNQMIASFKVPDSSPGTDDENEGENIF
jgi:penicillin V acylase-like amidase (Ntn superfamily)